MDIGGRRPAIFQCKTNKMSGLGGFLKDGRGDDIRSVSFQFIVARRELTMCTPSHNVAFHTPNGYQVKPIARRRGMGEGMDVGGRQGAVPCIG